MKKIDNLEYVVNKAYNITDKLNISISNNRIDLNIQDKCIENAFIELYDSIPKRTQNLLKSYNNALKNPQKLKKFLQRKDVQKYIVWDKNKLCYKLNFNIKIKMTDEIINNAFRALYPMIDNDFEIEEDFKMEEKNKKMNELIRKQAGKNNPIGDSMNNLIRAAATRTPLQNKKESSNNDNVKFEVDLTKLDKQIEDEVRKMFRGNNDE